MKKDNIEEVYLGGLIVDFNGELYGINEENFYNPFNKEVFKTILSLKEEGAPINLVTIKEKNQSLDSVLLINIANSTYTSSEGEYYARLLKNHTKKIELKRIADEISLYANNSDKINGEVYDFANKLLALNTMSEDNYSIDNDIYNLQEYLYERKGKELFGFSWGENLKFLDNYTKGIQKGRTYRIGAPSNIGKTWLSYNIINNLLKQDAKVAFFTLENDKSFTLSNILANHQQVNSYKIEDGTVFADVDYLKSKEGKLYIIDDCYELNEIQTRVMEIKPDIVILDYIGLVQIKKVKEDDKYTEYSKSTQEFVKRSRVGWIDLSNLPKGQEDEEAIRTFGGFYGSSFLKNNTDVGIHLCHYKPFYEYKKQSFMSDGDLAKVFSDEPLDLTRNHQVAQMLITKNRIGTAKVEAIFKIDFNKGGYFKEATKEELDKWNI